MNTETGKEQVGVRQVTNEQVGGSIVNTETGR